MLTSSSKKMRLSASLPRFGINLGYASPARMWYHGTTHVRQSIEAPQGRGGLRTFVASGRVVVVPARFRPTKSEYFVLLGGYLRNHAGAKLRAVLCNAFGGVKALILGEARPRVT
jgi:hypothetical protein